MGLEDGQEIFQLYGGSSFIVDVVRMEISPENDLYFSDIMFVQYKDKEYELRWDDYEATYHGKIEGKEGYIG